MTKRELIEENEMLKEVLQSWLDVDMLDLVPSYEDNRDLRNEKSKAVINGDLNQSDLGNASGGLERCMDTLELVEGVAVCELDYSDIIRSDIVARILKQLNNYTE